MESDGLKIFSLSLVCLCFVVGRWRCIARKCIVRKRSCSDGANERRSHRTYHCMYGNKSCITDGIYSFMYERLAYTYSMFILSDTRPETDGR